MPLLKNLNNMVGYEIQLVIKRAMEQLEHELINQGVKIAYSLDVTDDLQMVKLEVIICGQGQDFESTDSWQIFELDESEIILSTYEPLIFIKTYPIGTVLDTSSELEEEIYDAWWEQQ